MNIVMVNGEKQCGKSTFCRIVEHLLMQSETAAIGYCYSLVTPIEFYLHKLWNDCPERAGSTARYTTEELKRMQIFGRNGREWMIGFGDMMRSMNENILVELLFSQIRYIEAIDKANGHSNANSILIENWGFPNELIFARSLLRPHDKLYTVHLNERVSRAYADGERFDGDNRFSLGHMAQLINPTPTYMAHLLDPDGGHASHNQPIVVECRSNWMTGL